MYVLINLFFLSLQYMKSGDVPLGIAAEKGHIQIVQRLLKARASVNHQNKVVAGFLTLQDNM